MVTYLSNVLNEQVGVEIECAAAPCIEDEAIVNTHSSGAVQA